MDTTTTSMLIIENASNRNNSLQTDNFHLTPTTKMNATLNIVIVGCGDYCYSSKMLIISIILFGEASNSNSKNKCIIHLITDSHSCSLDNMDNNDNEMKFIISQLPKLQWLELNIIKHKDIMLTNTSYKETTMNLTTDFLKMEDMFSKCAALRLFLPRIAQFNNMQYIFYLDSDILCFKDIDEILNEWDINDENNIYMAMTTNDADPSLIGGWYVHIHYPSNDYYGNNGLNSGVMFYNLEKARNDNFVWQLINIYYWRDDLNGNQFHYKHPKQWLLGDQDLINYYFANHQHVNTLRILNCDWNVRLQKHCFPQYMINNFIMHGRSQTFLRKPKKKATPWHNTYDILKEYMFTEITNIQQRDLLREKLE